MAAEIIRSKTKLQTIEYPSIWDEMLEKWPSPIVARDKVPIFSGGLVSGRTVANADARGEGPSERVELGARKVGYTAKSLVAWLKQKCTVYNVLRKADSEEEKRCMR